MSSTGSGCLLVVSGGRRIGIITTSDLVRSISAGVDAKQANVAAYMSEDPATVDPGEPTARAAARMAAAGVSHLIVIEDGEPTGLLSARDLIGHRERVG
jgi:CBS domain-containing protein